MGSHRHQRAIGQDELRLIPEPFNATEDVIPSAAVEPGRMIFQLVENFIHLKPARIVSINTVARIELRGIPNES